MPWVSLSEVRAEGFLETTFPNARVEAAIEEVESLISRVTGNWFDVRSLTLKLDGSGSSTLLLPVPIIAVSSVSISGDSLDLDGVIIYNRHLSGMMIPDDRSNPKLVRRSGRFPCGSQNVEVTGTFGYRDYDPLSASGKIPSMLKRAVFLLLRRSLEKAASPYAWDAWRNHDLKKITTRGQSREYGGHVANETNGTLTGDVEADRILARFMAPLVGGVV